MLTTDIAHGLPFPGPTDGIVVCAETIPLRTADVLIVQTFLNDRGELDWLFYAHPMDLQRDQLVPLVLEALLRLDPTLREIADLPADWVAVREQVGGAWVRFPRPRLASGAPAR